MNEREKQLWERLRATFREEAREHIEALASQLLKIEKPAAPGETAEAIEAAFREAHNLKGAARAVKSENIESICQSMESVFAAMKRGHLSSSPQSLDVLLRAVRVLDELQTESESNPAAQEENISQIQASLRSILQGRPGAALESSPARTEAVSPTERPRPPGSTDRVSPASSQEARPIVPLGGQSSQKPQPAVRRTPVLAAEESVRVPASKIDTLFWHAEELLLIKLASLRFSREARCLRDALDRWRQTWKKMQLNADSLQRAMASGTRAIPPGEVAKLLDLLDSNRLCLDSLADQASGLTQGLLQHQRALSVRADQLLDDSRKLFMLPCAWLLDALRPLVRELARDQSKEIELAAEGGAIQMDRRVLLELKDPFIHMVRNSVAHGIEKPDERAARGKPGHGTITISISQIGGHRVELTFRDDGRGADLPQIQAAAVKAGLLREEKARELGEQATLNLLFESGVSTSAALTDLSGRGLGMAIVREKVESLEGTVQLENHPGAGLTVRMNVPLTVATCRGVLVRAADRVFVIPAAKIERVGRKASHQIRSVENRPAIEYGESALALARLSDLLRLPLPREEAGPEAGVSFVLLRQGEARLALAVDEICGQQEVLVKGLGEQLKDLPFWAGATVLASGKIALILDAPSLFREALRWNNTAVGTSAQTKAPKSVSIKRPSILLAEDSITSRTLLKNILEMAGYAVSTAVDGMDALAKLRSEEYQLLVSDVDMPRLNGFALTAKIRADRKLGALPVVLVTALDSPEDRERGLHAGANAYIVKRGFEQGTLLEAIRKLI